MKLFNIFLVTLCIYFVICLVNADDIIEGDENQENQTERKYRTISKITFF